MIKKSEAQRIATSVTLQRGDCRVNLGVVLFLDNPVGAVEEGDDTTTKPVFLGGSSNYMGFLRGIIGGGANLSSELISHACVAVFG